ncbi:MAG: translation initiation factor IF-2 [Thermoproteota archaeon]
MCRKLPGKVVREIKVPGLLVIDTPGHEAFMNLRRRGGSIADIAILVIDVIKGVEPQTMESFEILRAKKTPFIVALNKIDQIPGWRVKQNTTFTESYASQEPSVRCLLDDRMYSVMGSLSQLGLRVERFDRISDFRKTVTVVPLSAKSGEGIAELIAVLVGLVQQFMVEELTVSDGNARGTVLEVKEEVGMGVTVNAIIYDGVLFHDDTIVVGGLIKPIVTKIRAILVPKPLDEMRDPRDRFLNVERVSAAAGVKIVATGLEEAMAGAPILSVPQSEDLQKAIEEVTAEVESVKVHVDTEGLVVKADTLGSLEALVEELKKKGFTVRMADVGNVTKRDVLEASISSKDISMRAVLAFNVKILRDAEEEGLRLNVPILQNKIIYGLINDYISLAEAVRREAIEKELGSIVRPGQVTLLPGYVFRRSKPAIGGFKVDAGTVKPGYRLINMQGIYVGEINQIQDQGKSIPEASEGSSVALSIEDSIIGRNMSEGESFLFDVPEQDARLLLSKFQNELSEKEKEALRKLVDIKRKTRSLWGY